MHVVNGVRAKQRDLGILVGNEGDLDPAQAGRAEEEVRVGVDDDAVAALPGGKEKRSVRDGGLRVERNMVNIGIFLQHVRRQNFKRLIALGEERVDEGSEGALEVHDGGVSVGCIDRRDVVVTVARNDVVIRVFDRLPRPADVARRERDAVAPANVVAQTIRNRQPVAADAAVCLRRYGLYEDRKRIAMRVGRHQRLEHQAIDEDFRNGPGQQRIEILRFFADGDA